MVGTGSDETGLDGTVILELKKEPIPWKAVYLEDPLDIMDDKKPEAPPDFQSRVNLPDMNRQWIANQEQIGQERLEEIFRMNNIGLF